MKSLTEVFSAILVVLLYVSGQVGQTEISHQPLDGLG